MTLGEFVATVPGFGGLKHSEKIKLFAWFLQTHGGRGTFRASDISACYRDTSTAPPSSVSPFLAAMKRRRPPEILGSAANGFKLERRATERITEHLGKRPSTVYVDNLLARLPSQVPDLGEKGYLDEALVCFRHGAFRAAVVMAWNVVYDHVCRVVLAKHLPEFNAQLPKSFPKAEARSVAKLEEFELLKESQVLQVCASARIMGQNTYNIAKEKLRRRNMAAHPTQVGITSATAEEFIRDLVENVLLRFA